MIRFVDLTEPYWCDPEGAPCCAFLDTVRGEFLEVWGSHVFGVAEDLDQLDPELRARCARLVPKGFWK